MMTLMDDNIDWDGYEDNEQFLNDYGYVDPQKVYED